MIDIEKLAYWVIAVFVVAILAVLCIGSWQNAGEFRAVCEKAGGTVVHDGRQYQCIKQVAK